MVAAEAYVPEVEVSVQDVRPMQALATRVLEQAVLDLRDGDESARDFFLDPKRHRLWCGLAGIDPRPMLERLRGMLVEDGKLLVFCEHCEAPIVGRALKALCRTCR